MTPAEVLATAQDHGVVLWTDPEGLLRWRCRGSLPDDLRQLLLDYKNVLLKVLLPASAESGFDGYCPRCRRPLDLKLTCWHCHYRRCSCGRDTGSEFIQVCVLCQASAEADVSSRRRKLRCRVKPVPSHLDGTPRRQTRPVPSHTDGTPRPRGRCYYCGAAVPEDGPQICVVCTITREKGTEPC